MNIGAYLYLIRGDEYKFPYQECVKSLLPFCDGVHVLTDPRFRDTRVVVTKLEAISQRVFVHQEEFDLDDPGIDGKSKARARELASAEGYDWLIQMDADEVFRAGDVGKVKSLLQSADSDLLCCGVINWFNGNHIKVTAPWSKERFSRNVSYITHGIPVQYCTEREDGYYGVSTEHKRGGADSDHTDGAGYIDKGGNSIAGDATTFCDADELIASSKGHKLFCNKDFYDSIEKGIWVHHYSWWAIPRRWQREATWNYLWGILRGKYQSLEDYESADGMTKDFFSLTKMRNPQGYREPIASEMKDSSIFYVDWIRQPALMAGWLEENAKYTYGRKKQALCKPKFLLRSILSIKRKRVEFE